MSETPSQDPPDDNPPPDDLTTDEFATELRGRVSASTLPGDGFSRSLETIGNPPNLESSSSVTERSSLRFRVLRPHAKGGLGQVLVAHDNDLHRDVAMKEIQDKYADGVESRARFVFEAEVTGRLEHPGIVPVYALGHHEDGRPYYAMRFITGTAMNDAIKQLYANPDVSQRNREMRDLLQRFVTVCNTIDFAHSRGYLHRDLKPANIMLGEYAETLVVDWGLAKPIDTVPDVEPRTGAASEELSEELDSLHTVGGGIVRDPNGSPTQSSEPIDPSATVIPHEKPSHPHRGHDTVPGRTVGTPQYMPPEQALGQSERMGPPSDVYSLGATLYHLLTGGPPLAVEKGLSLRKLLRKVTRGEIPSAREVRSDVPKSLDAICQNAMATDPDDRYPTARALARDIENYLADDRVSVVPETWIDQLGRWTRKNRGMSATIAAAVLTIALVATVFYGITQNALNRTQRYLTISQLQQRFDTGIKAEDQRLDRVDLVDKEIAIGQEQVARSRELIEEIEELQRVDAPGFVDSNRRFALLQSWSASIDQLSDQTMNRDLHERLLEEVERLENNYPFPNEAPFVEELARLSKAASERISQWFVVPMPGAQSIDIEAADLGIVPLTDAPSGNVELTAQFDGDLSVAKTVGLCLNTTNVSGYQFLVTDQSYHPVYGYDTLPSLAESNDLDHLVAMIVRGDDVLRVQPITLSDSPIRLTARRESGTLLTLIYGDDQVRFEDLFPLGPEDPGNVGVLVGPGMRVSDIQLESQRDPRTKSDSKSVAVNPIELGDQAFAEGDFVSARSAYEQRPNSVEALAKRALVLEYTDPGQYVSALRQIIEDHAPEGVQASSDRRWYLYAGVRLFLHYLNQDDDQYRATSILSRLNVNYTLEDVQSLIPESQRQLFSQALLKPGKRTRVLFDNGEDLESLDGAIELFSNNDQWRRLAYWRKADALRYDWKSPPDKGRAAAAPILDRLINEMENDRSVDELTLVTLVGDRVWLQILDNQFDESLSLLQRFLPEPGLPIKGPRLPLLIDRARVLIAKNDFLSPDSLGDPSSLQLAKEDLLLFLERVDPVRPPVGIHYSHFGSVCGIMGLLEERAGRSDEALEYWQRGRRRNWGPYVFDTARVIAARGAMMVLETETPEPILSAWTDGYRGNEWSEIVDETLAGSGLSDLAIRNLILNSEQIPNEWIQLVAEKCFSGVRGRSVGEGTLLHQLPLMQTNTDSVSLIFYQAILHLALDGEATLQTYPGLDEMLFDRCQRIQLAFQEQRIGWNEMAFILAAFSGSWNESSFLHLRETLADDDLAVGLAMVFGLMQLKQQENPEKFREIFNNHIKPYQAELPSTYFDICNDHLDR